MIAPLFFRTLFLIPGSLLPFFDLGARLAQARSLSGTFIAALFFSRDLPFHSSFSGDRAVTPLLSSSFCCTLPFLPYLFLRRPFQFPLPERSPLPWTYTMIDETAFLLIGFFLARPDPWSSQDFSYLFLEQDWSGWRGFFPWFLLGLVFFFFFCGWGGLLS